MPAIKLKKAAAEHQAEKEREERERESEVPTNVPAKPKESHPGASLLRGLDTNILFEKRKRTLPPSEQKLVDWMESNLETKEDCHVNLNAMYEYFGEACTFDGTAVVDQLVFNKRIAEKFGKAFALKESSPYKGLIKEKKAKDKGKVVKADTLKLKMKDIIEEAIKEAGNPVKGVRFFSLKQYIACNYPALRVDLRPGYLKVALERGVRYGYIQLVRGVGLSGYYRLPVDEEPDETEEKPDDEKTETTSDEHVTEEQNGDAEGAEVKADDEAAPAKSKKKSRKRKSAEGEGGEEGEETGEEGESKKKKKKKPKRRRPRFSDNYHSSPQKIEDTFALAMTYMCEPKQTSFGKIRRYIAEHYPHVDIGNELKAKMESGEKKGYWEHVTGQGLAGTFRLMIDEFDPNSTDNIEDMICSAIIACNEPKQASANLLKKYVMEYHPEFKIESRPHYFKNALERALKKQMIIQLSGIGASGSFQMWSVFSPSPALLAGEDDSEDENIFTEKEEAYVPRGTKSRGNSVRKNPIERAAEYRGKPQKRSAPANRSDTPSKKAASSKVRSRPKSAKSSSRSRAKVNYSEKEQGVAEEEDQEEEEADDEEEDEPAPKRARKASKASKAKKGKRQAKASPKKKGQKPVSRAQLAEAEEEEEEVEEEVEEEEEANPKKSKKSKAVEEEEEEVTPVKSSRGRSRSRPNYAEGKGDSDDDEAKSSKGRKSSGGRRGSKTVSYGEKDDEDDDEGQEKAEYTPRKSKSRGGDEEEAETSTSPKKKGKKRR